MRLKVLSFNIHKGFGYFNKNYNINTIRTLLEIWVPDIIMLQELHGIHPANNNIDISPLELLADEHWPFHQHGVNSVYSNNFHGNAIISRYPIQSWKNIDISTNPFEKRGLLETSILLPNEQKISVICTHLNLFVTGQMKQSKIIVDLIHSQNIDPIAIVGGDFNDWLGVVGREITKNDAFKEAPRKNTFPSIFPLMTLDKVFYRGMRVAESKILLDYRFCSDHLPILVEFEITE